MVSFFGQLNSFDFFQSLRAAFVSRANVTDFYEWFVIQHEIWACEWELVCSHYAYMYVANAFFPVFLVFFFFFFFHFLLFVYGNTNIIIIINNIITIIWRLQLSRPDIKLFESNEWMWFDLRNEVRKNNFIWCGNRWNI